MDLHTAKARLGQQIEANLRLRAELSALRGSVREGKKRTPYPPAPFDLPGYQCDRCRVLFDSLLRTAAEMSRAAMSASRAAGKLPLNNFCAALLEAQSFRQECATIRQEYVAHEAIHAFRDNRAISSGENE